MEIYLLMPSNCSQDRFVVDTLRNDIAAPYPSPGIWFIGLADNQHKNGFWVELGCQGPINSSNTHILEESLAWTGLSIDISQPHIDLWEGVRSTDHLVCGDALSLDYEQLFKEHDVPEVVDYLSVDLEPPPITFTAVQKIPFHKYKFKTITFEHDHYREEFLHYNLREDSRKFFDSIGYFKVPDHIADTFSKVSLFKVSFSEDWYVHPELIDVGIFK